MFPESFSRLAQLAGIDPENTSTWPARSKELSKHFFQYRYLPETPANLLSTDLAVLLGFLSAVADKKAKNGQDPWKSPVNGLPDSSWMTESDFCMIHARACGSKPAKPGSFIEAAKLLPGLRATAVLLLPFFHCCNGRSYAVNSFHLLDPVSVDPVAEKAGIDGPEQLRFLCDTAHLLGKTIGFDLTPHTAQFSMIALERPELFRWLKLDRNKMPAGGKSQKEMLSPETQEIIREGVKAISARARLKHGIDSFDPPTSPPEVVTKAHSAAVKELILEGFWTLPTQSWDGVGLPAFKGYDLKGDFPEFDYRTITGDDASNHKLGLLTPFRFFDGLEINSSPDGMSKPEPVEEVQDFFSSIAPGLIKKYGFDFLRVCHVDHVFNSIVNSDPEFPISDRLTPALIARVLTTVRDSLPWAGAIAERLSDDIETFRPLGFDVLMGWEIGSCFDATSLGTSIARWRLFAKSTDTSLGQSKASVALAVDTQDSAHPLVFGKPRGESCGTKGMLIRYFAGKFGFPGKGRRPLIEVMGNQDMTTGIYDTLLKPKCLNWAGDIEFLKLYHNLFDIYEKFRHLFEEGVLTRYYFDHHFCYWYIDVAYEGRISERLVCLINPDWRTGPTILNYCINLMDTANGAYRFVPPPSQIYEILLDRPGMERRPFVGGTYAFPQIGPGDIKILYLMYRLSDSEAM